jgi:hypothetical protein
MHPIHACRDDEDAEREAFIREAAIAWLLGGHGTVLRLHNAYEVRQTVALPARSPAPQLRTTAPHGTMCGLETPQEATFARERRMRTTFIRFSISPAADACGTASSPRSAVCTHAPVCSSLQR